MKTSLILLITGSLLGVTLALGSPAAADCGDGVTNADEACDNGTPVCQAGSKNRGAECCKSEDCLGTSTNPHTGATGDLCQCTGGSCRGGSTGTGNRDDVPNACRCTCMTPMCGDGVSDSAFNEECDNGTNNGPNKPCLDNEPNSVCINTGTGAFCRGGAAAGGNPDALIRCSNDAVCIAATACGGAGKCAGNPQCLRNQCGDDFVCSDASCTSGTSALNAPAGSAGPEACDDSNTSNMDSCTAFGFLFTAGGTPQIPHQCQANICGDGATNMNVEECDAGLSLCISGPKATTPPSKPCCSNMDCMVGGVTGICSNAVAPGNSNNPGGPTTCRCACTLPACGDGISDSALLEECDDGTVANGPGHFCNKERRCIGGENGCVDANGNGKCDSDLTENGTPGTLSNGSATRLAAGFCATNNDCIKGTCGKLECAQNVCGDGIVGGMEMCDDGNTVLANDSAHPSDACGVNATTAEGVNAVRKPGCGTTVGQNTPNACIPALCILPFCGDGITNAGEMCDSGTATCIAPAFNAGVVCVRASDCKRPPGVTADLCSATGNRDDVRDYCRSTCMPPACGDGVSDSNEQCDTGAGNGLTKPCTSVCTPATCGDGQVCSDPACTSGPNGGPEQCDDGNAINPSSTNTDACWHQCPGPLCCRAAFCGDGVTSPGEQCDSTAMGCSNMREAASAAQQQVEPELECCYAGEVVNLDKQGPGLISANQGFVSLNVCKIPNAIESLACDAWLQKKMIRILSRVVAAELYAQQGNLSRAQRVMRNVTKQVNSIMNSRRLAKEVAPGGSCNSVRIVVGNELLSIRDLSAGISGHLNQYGGL